jgi:peptidoglycan/LPS O-acetylase OafA/YrhL
MPVANPLLNYIFVVGGWLCTRYKEFDFFSEHQTYLKPLSYTPLLLIIGCTYLSTQLGLTILMVPALSGILCLLQFSMLLNHFSVLPFLKTLGVHSLSIFILHTLVAAACRIMLTKLNISDPIVHQVLGTVSGLFIPLIIFAGLKKVKLSDPLFLH